MAGHLLNFQTGICHSFKFDPNLAKITAHFVVVFAMKMPIFTSFLTFQLTSRREEPDFKGAEDSLPRTKEQKKIQIEIRRNIASNRISRSPVRRSIRDPNTVYISRFEMFDFFFISIIFQLFSCNFRSSEEGRYPIFDRDDIKRFIPKHPEKRVIAIVDEKRQRSRSR